MPSWWTTGRIGVLQVAIWTFKAFRPNRLCCGRDLEERTSQTDIFGPLFAPTPWLVLSSQSIILVLRLQLLCTSKRPTRRGWRTRAHKRLSRRYVTS